MRKKHFFLLLALWSTIIMYAQNKIDLAGEWKFAQGEHPAYNDRITLPGSMLTNGKGDDVTINTQWVSSLYDSSFYFNPYMEKYRVQGNLKFPFFLTPEKHYVGHAWYSRTVSVPKSWKKQRVLLFLERPHIETTVFINGKEAGRDSSLSVPHVFDVTRLILPGKENEITVNVYNGIENVCVGQDSHSVTDQTQGDWNGIAGRIELQAHPMEYIANVQVYPDIDDQTIEVALRIEGGKGKHDLSFHVAGKQHERKALVPDEKGIVKVTLPMGNDVKLWDEFSPNLYTLTSVLDKDTVRTTFGMRKIEAKGRQFYLNGKPIWMRGTVENCCFPLTGYPPTDEASWLAVFRKCKEYGLNMMRFHSYCPPEAAFKAADRVGFYLQPEGPSWPNHGPKLGLGQPIDQYLMDETRAMTRTYGNHASFCMMAAGNEPAGRWVEWVSQFVDYWKATDSRRVYTGASVGGSWQWQPHNQYHVKAGARGLTWAKSRPETMSDYRERIDTVSQPYVSHETGQWCAFPNFEEIRKYTGINKAKNFEIFRDILEDNHMGAQAHNFLMASGKLQALCYKYEIEKTLLTPDYAGFQLLALNDYSGQGTALVGVLDAFFDEKGYIDAPTFRRFCNPTVPLARIPKFVYTSDETLQADIEIAHFGAKPLKNAKVTYTIRRPHGETLVHGILCTKDIPIGNCFTLGPISYPLNALTEPCKLNLEVRLEGTEAVNDWDFWVYPAQTTINEGQVYTTDTLDTHALKVLKDGGKVLITAAGKVKYGKQVAQYFTPVFWNTSWFKMRPPHTTGIYLNEYHPLFRHFPTEYHSNLQWWELLNRAQVMQFTHFPDEFQPLVQSIDTWFLSRKIGMLFEANVLRGKLIMTTMDLTSAPEQRIVARQMRKAIYDYMNSDDFRPQYDVTPEQIQALFTQEAEAVNSYTKDSPDELKPKKNK